MQSYQITVHFFKNSPRLRRFAALMPPNPRLQGIFSPATQIGNFIISRWQTLSTAASTATATLAQVNKS